MEAISAQQSRSFDSVQEAPALTSLNSYPIKSSAVNIHEKTQFKSLKSKITLYMYTENYFHTKVFGTRKVKPSLEIWYVYTHIL